MDVVTNTSGYPRQYAYYFTVQNEDYIIYAESEVVAKEKYRKIFGVDAAPYKRIF